MILPGWKALLASDLGDEDDDTIGPRGVSRVRASDLGDEDDDSFGLRGVSRVRAECIYALPPSGTTPSVSTPLSAARSCLACDAVSSFAAAYF